MENIILESDKLKLLSNNIDDKYRLYLFNPSIFRLFPKSGNMHEMNLRQSIRFFLLFIHGYRVYVLGDNENSVVACAVFANGKTYRYPFANKNDLICGPYFVLPEYRKQGIATKLLTYVIANYETEYNSIFAHIWYENTASICCMEKLGFKKVDTLKSTKILQKCVSDKDGKLILVEKKNSCILKE